MSATVISLSTAIVYGMQAGEIVPFEYRRDYLNFARIEIQRFDQPMTRTQTDFLLKKHGNRYWWVMDYDGNGKIDTYIIAGINQRDELHVFSIAVREEYEGVGLAGRMLDHLVKQARQESIGCIYLEVRESNLRARSLYISRGFIVQDRIDDYYDEGVHAVIMILDVRNAG